MARGSMLRTVRRCNVRRFSSASGAPKIGYLVDSLERLKPAEQRFTLASSTPISAAAQHLLEQRLTFSLIVDDVTSGDSQRHHTQKLTSSAVVGMLTERDILRYTTQAGSLAFFSGREHGSPAVSKWMTPFDSMLSVRLDDEIDQALSTIHTGIWRHLPVLDHWNRLHSILDVRDVLMHSIQDAGDGGAWHGSSAADILATKRKSRIGAAAPDGTNWPDALAEYLLAHAKRHTISSRVSVEKAAKQMQQEQLTFLVVCEAKEKGEKVVGLVNERSFLAFCTDSHVDGGAAPVGSLMTPLEETLTVNLTDPASHVISTFFNNNVRHLPVVDGRERLVGIISMRDLLRPLLTS